MDTLYISKCKNGHHFINSKFCCICGEPVLDKIPFKEGDCINCGQLCPGHAYSCSEPVVLSPDDFES